MPDLGSQLKLARETQNISLEEISASTKISLRYLEALESDRYDLIPGKFFLKAIIKTYARSIGLDEKLIVEKFLAAGIFGDQVKSVPEQPQNSQETKPSSRKNSFYWLLAGIFLALSVLAIALIIISGRQSPASRTKISASPPAIQQEVVQPQIEAPPASEAIASQPASLVLMIEFNAETWLQIYADGVLKAEGIFFPGKTITLEAEKQLLIHTGNAGGFSFSLNNQPGKSFGRSGEVKKNVMITLDNWKDFVQTPGPASAPT